MNIKCMLPMACLQESEYVHASVHDAPDVHYDMEVDDSLHRNHWQ